MSRPRPSKKHHRLAVQRLEDRTVPAVFGNPWADAQHLTVSFVPDGTMVNGAASSLFQTMPWQSATWQREILRALQTWVAAANIDVDLVSDSGASIGTRGPTQGDSRFGDIRVAARPLSDNVLAITAPPGYLGGTRAGDIVINSNKIFSIGGSANSYDLYSCMLQECGHALGIDNSTDPASPMYETYSGVRTGLTAGDIADIQSLYGSRTNDAFDNGGGNQYSSTATALNLPLGIALNSSLVVNASISTPGDVDYYKVHTQLLNFGGMTVRLNAGSSLLAPKVTVYGPAGNVVGSAQSLNPQSGELVISLSSVQSLATYTIRVEAANSAFAVGDYQLKVVFDPNALDFVFNAVGQLRDDLHTDDILAAAFRLNTTAGYTSQTHYSQTATIRDAYDVDVYVIRSAVVSGNQQSAMTINVRTLGQSTLDPMIVVYNAQQQQVAAKIIVNDDGTYTVQVNNTTSNSDYFVKIKSANTGGTGNYQLDVDFRTVSINLQEYAKDSLSSPAAVTTRTMTISQSQTMHFALAATGNSGASVRMTIMDSSGAVVAVLESLVGQTTTLDAYFGADTYTVQFQAVVPTGVSAVDLAFDLDGTVVTDPIGPRTSNGQPTGTANSNQNTVTWAGSSG